jgi:ribosomal protein L11 methyltransferase
VVVANLVGALIVRAAARLAQAVAPGGVLILSGILASERGDVENALANLGVTRVVQEDEWLAITIQS